MKTTNTGSINKNSENGAITLFVLLACLFFAFILSGVYISNLNKLQVQEQYIKQIQKNYARQIERKEEIYQELSNKGIYVTLYTDGTLGFSNNTETISRKTVAKSYGNIAGKVYHYISDNGKVSIDTPWFIDKDNIININFINEISPTNTGDWFFGCDELLKIDNIENLKTDKILQMHRMFANCSSLSGLDVSGFNTVNVKNMDGIFQNCSSLTNLDVSNFNTSNVTNMANMFKGCSNLTSLDVTKFNTNKVTNMINMFYGCSKLTNIKLDNFDTSNVTDMASMFCECKSLINLNLNNFNTSNVTKISFMFKGCTSLEDLNISNFDTSKVVNMSAMFMNCYSLTNLNLSNFNTQNVTNMVYNEYGDSYNHGMFYGCTNLKNLNISSFDFSKVTKTDTLFWNMPTKSNGTIIYVKDQKSQQLVLNSIGHPSDWDTTNVIIK